MVTPITAVGTPTSVFSDKSFDEPGILISHSEDLSSLEYVREGVVVLGSSKTVHITDINKHKYILSRPLFELLRSASPYYHRASIVSISDLLLWQIKRLLADLKTVIQSQSVSRAEEIRAELDALEGWIGVLVSWISLMEISLKYGNDPSGYLEEDTKLYTAQRTDFFTKYATLPFIQKRLEYFKEYFSVPFEAAPVFSLAKLSIALRRHAEKLKKEALIPIEAIRHQLADFIGGCLVFIENPITIPQLADVPLQNIFHFGLARAGFSQNYYQVIQSLLDARSRIHFSSANISIAARSTLATLDLKTSRNDRLKALFSLACDREFLQYTLQKYLNREDIDLCERSFMQAVALHLGLIVTLLVQEAGNLFADTGYAISISLESLIQYMALLERWSPFFYRVEDIPKGLSSLSKRYLVRLSLILSEILPDSSESRSSIEFSQKDAHHFFETLSDASDGISFIIMVNFILSFNQYPKMDTAALKLTQWFKEFSLEIQKGKLPPSDLVLLEEIFKREEMMQALSIIEFLPVKFRNTIFAETQDSPAHAVQFVDLIKISLLPKCEGDSSLSLSQTIEKACDPEPTVSKGEKVLSALSLSCNETVSEVAEEVDFRSLQEFDDTLSGPSSFESSASEMSYEDWVERERKRSLAKRMQKNTRASCSSVEQDGLMVSVEDYFCFDPALLKELRDPVRMKSFLARSGIKFTREGGNHTILSAADGSTFALPRHPGKELSIGVRRKALQIQHSLAKSHSSLEGEG